MIQVVLLLPNRIVILFEIILGMCPTLMKRQTLNLRLGGRRYAPDSNETPNAELPIFVGMGSFLDVLVGSFQR